MTTWKITEPERLVMDDEVKNLEVKLAAGRLNVVGAEGPARVEVTAIGERPVIVTIESGVLTVAQEFPRKWRGIFWWLFSGMYKVDVSVVVPDTSLVGLNVVSGTVIASSLRNGADVDVTSGRITMLGIDGNVSGKIVSGSIEGLTLGGEVDLETVSGEIVVADSTARRVYARTISGSVTCDLDNPPADTDVRLETVSGEIIVRVREDSDLRVNLNAVSGRVVNAFPELDQVTRGVVTGRLGTGTGGRLGANATSGTISLLRRPVDDEEGRPVDDEEESA
jgi:hypothetical protein